MPKLSEYSDRLDDCAVEYTLHESKSGSWHAELRITTAGEDAIEVANNIAKAMRQVARERPDHNVKCVCVLCTEWKMHNAKERLDG